MGNKLNECARKSAWENFDQETGRSTYCIEGKVREEQGGFKKGRGCVDQIFAIKRLVEEYLGKDKKLYAAFMDLEKAYDRVDREAF